MFESTRIVLATVIATSALSTRSAAQIEIQAFGGSAASLPLPITISQNGFPDLHFTAHWDTKPLRRTYYYAARVGFWKANRAWRIDFTHHKVYLNNPPPDVETFRITNGFNILTLSRAYRRNHFTYSLGAGPVVTYPISVVRGARFTAETGRTGYFLGGGTLMAMATRELPLPGPFIMSLDLRASASYVRVPIVNGHANVPNAALHFHVGLGYLNR